MTFPIDLHIGVITIPSHLITDILSLVIAAKYYEIVRKRYHDPLSDNNRLAIVIAGGLGAFIGSRLLGALEQPDLFFNPPSLLYYLSSKTLVGGLIGGILAIEGIKKYLSEKKSSGDLFVYPVILGMIISRIGCLLTGVTDATVGLPSSLPWAFDQGDGIARHPTSLYEMIFLGALWIALLYIEKRYPLKNGVLFRLFMIGYMLFRFLVEFIKPVTPLALGLSGIQLAGLLISIYYFYELLFVYGRKNVVQ